MADPYPDRPGSHWFDGAPASLPSYVKRLEHRLATARFVDGAINRLCFGEGLLPAGSTALNDGGMGIGRASDYLRAFSGMSQENLIQAVLDGAASMVVRKPAYKFVTDGGSWKKQVAARKLSRLMTGVYTTSGLEAAVPAVFLDSCRCMVAASKWSVDPDTGDAKCERALPHTIVWNPAEGPNPRNLAQRHGISRQMLSKRYPDLACEIEKLPAFRPDPAFHVDVWSWTSDPDQVEVFESWRLPDGKDQGRYVMTIGALVAEDEEWDLPFFPLVPLTYGDSYNSLAGNPLARQILPFQLRLNRMNRVIDEVQTKCAAPKLAIPNDAEVTGVSSAVAEVIRYNAAGGEVHWLPGQMLPPEYYAEKERVKQSAFAQGGVSQSVAAATKAPGLNSGRAQREAYDQASGRLVLAAERLERWFERNALVALGLMKRQYAGKAQRIKAPNTRALDEIDWKDVGGVVEDGIEVRCYITSSIPMTPAGRAETLAERVEAGIMTQRRATRWYADPDMSTLEDEDSAAEDLARKIVSSALEDGVYIAPDPILGPDGLAILVEVGGSDLMKAMTLPEPPPAKNRELCRRVVAAAQDLLKPPAPPPGPPGIAPGAPAGPVPGLSASPAPPPVQLTGRALNGAQAA